MSKSNGMPTMVVVGLGMVLIAALAAVAAWAWSHRRGPLLHRQRSRHQGEEGEEGVPEPQGDQSMAEEPVENGAGPATSASA